MDTLMARILLTLWLALACSQLHAKQLIAVRSSTLPAAPATFEVPYSLPAGSTITVGSDVGDDYDETELQDALDFASPGDVISLRAGDTFSGDFVLPDNGTDTDWIYIISSALGSLPAEGTRVAPADASNMPKIQASGSNPWCVRTAPGANHYRIVGVEITKAASNTTTVDFVRTGMKSDASTYETDIAEISSYIVFDRCYVHGTANDPSQVGINLDGEYQAVIDCVVSDIHSNSNDSQAILSVNAVGPLLIKNNLLQATGECILIGGRDPDLANISTGHRAYVAGASTGGAVPSDIVITGNTISKSLTWKEDDPSWDDNAHQNKNLFELKNASRVLFDSNICEYCWSDAQDGTAIVIKSVNQDNTAPWSVTQDVTISNNVIRHVASGVRLSGRGDDYATDNRTRRIRIVNNLIYDVNKTDFGGDGRPWEFDNDHQNVTVAHNTCDGEGNTMITLATSAGGPYLATGFVYKDNIAPRLGDGSTYTGGVKAGGEEEGSDSLDAYLTDYVFTNNVIAKRDSETISVTYPTGNFFPDDMDSVGFTNRASADYSLSSGAYIDAATDGTDVGVDTSALPSF